MPGVDLIPPLPFWGYHLDQALLPNPTTFTRHNKSISVIVVALPGGNTNIWQQLDQTIQDAYGQKDHLPLTPTELIPVGQGLVAFVDSFLAGPVQADDVDELTWVKIVIRSTFDHAYTQGWLAEGSVPAVNTLLSTIDNKINARIAAAQGHTPVAVSGAPPARHAPRAKRKSGGKL